MSLVKFKQFFEEKDPRLAKAGVTGFNKAKRTPSHPTKSHIVVAKPGDKVKTIRFGQQGAETAGDPKKGESERMKKKRASFKARHGKNIAKGKMSAAYWADANLQDDHNKMHERMNKHSEKLDDIEKICNDNHRTICVINKLFWVVTVAVVGSIITQLGVFS